MGLRTFLGWLLALFFISLIAGVVSAQGLGATNGDVSINQLKVDLWRLDLDEANLKSEMAVHDAQIAQFERKIMAIKKAALPGQPVRISSYVLGMQFHQAERLRIASNLQLLGDRRRQIAAIMLKQISSDELSQYVDLSQLRVLTTFDPHAHCDLFGDPYP